MQTDPSKSEEFRELEVWKDQKYNNDMKVLTDRSDASPLQRKLGFQSNSLSGKERNRVFMRHKDNFADVSLVSGADDINDGRGSALIDFDQDGWTDIACMSLNNPRFKLYKNEMKRYYPENKSLRFRLVGGQLSDEPSGEFSNRDGIGARALVTFKSGKSIMMHRQAGEGFATQNSATLLIGIPKGDAVSRIDVRWPSGKTTSVDSPDTNDVLVINERTEK